MQSGDVVHFRFNVVPASSIPIYVPRNGSYH